LTRLWPFVRGRPPYPSPPNKASLPIAASNRRGRCWASRKDREIRSNAARVLDRLAINYEFREYCERSVFFVLMVRNLLTKSAIRERVVFATSCFIREPPMTVLLRSGVLLSRSAAMNSGPMWGITKSSGWWQKHGADLFIPGGIKKPPAGQNCKGSGRRRTSPLAMHVEQTD